MRVVRVSVVASSCVLFAAASTAQSGTDRALPKALQDALNGENWQSAHALASAAIRTDPENAHLQAALSDALYGLDRARDGLAAADRALALDPELPSGWCARADCLFELSRYIESAEAYRAYAQREPGSSYAISGLAWCHTRRGDFLRAQATFGVAVRMAPDSPFYREFLGLAAHYAGRYDLALVQLQEAEKRGDSALAAGTGRLETLRKAGRFDEARELADRITQLAAEPGSRDERWLQSAILHRSTLHLLAGSTNSAREAARRLSSYDRPGWDHFYELLFFYADSIDGPYVEALNGLDRRLTERGIRDDPDVAELVRILSEDLSIADLLAGPSNDTSSPCQRLFLAAWRADRLGHPERAKRLLILTVNTGNYRWEPYDMAREMLKARGVDLFSTHLGFTTDPEDSGALGLEISSIAGDSAAKVQGLRVGDRIVEVQDLPLTVERWRYALRNSVVGSDLVFTVRRDGKDRRVEFKPGLKPD